MADRSITWPDNAPGPVFVDQNCTCCGMCVLVSPQHFAYSDAGDHARSTDQPRTGEEMASCQEAADCCPVDAIGLGECDDPAAASRPESMTVGKPA